MSDNDEITRIRAELERLEAEHSELVRDFYAKRDESRRLAAQGIYNNDYPEAALRVRQNVAARRRLRAQLPPNIPYGATLHPPSGGGRSPLGATSTTRVLEQPEPSQLKRLGKPLGLALAAGTLYAGKTLHDHFRAEGKTAAEASDDGRAPSDAVTRGVLGTAAALHEELPPPQRSEEVTQPAQTRRGMNPFLAAGLGVNAASAGISFNKLYRDLGEERARQALSLAENAVPRRIDDIRAAKGALLEAQERALRAARLDRFRTPAAAAGTVLTGVGLYQAGQPVEKAAALRFDTQQEAQAHLRNRELGGVAGMAVGGLLGARAGQRRWGTKGLLGGALLGAAVGNPAGRVATDVAHDLPDRTSRTHRETQNRLNTAAGIRIASATPTAEDFEAFAQEDTTAGEGTETPPKDTAALPDRTGTPSWGPKGSTDGLSGLVPSIPPYAGV